MVELHTHPRRFGRTAVMVKQIAELLKLGETIVIAESGLVNRDFLLHELRSNYGLSIECEPVMAITPMRVVYDMTDPSPEPAITGIDFGKEVRFGHKIKLITNGTDSTKD